MGEIPMSYEKWYYKNVGDLCTCRAISCPWLSKDPKVAEYATAGGMFYCKVMRAKYNSYVHFFFDENDEAAAEYFVSV